MTDDELKVYLDAKNNCVYSSDLIDDVLNTSSQIIMVNFDRKNKLATIITDNNTFNFKWKIKENTYV